MDRGKLHLTSLRAFEAAGRLGNISTAAEELCVTRTAVTHQINHLEERLGLQLLTRTNRGVRVTEAGETLLPVLIECFDKMVVAMDGLARDPGTKSLRVTTTPAFAARWLVPRLRKWHARHPGDDIHLLPTLQMLSLSNDAADISIRCGIPPWIGLEAELILPIHMTPVCSPAFLEQAGGSIAPDEITNHPLIHSDITGHELGEEWRAWLNGAGLTQFRNLSGLSFHDPGLAMQAAIDGLGITIGYEEFIGPDIGAGRLVRLSGLAVRHAYSYYVVQSEARRNDERISIFKSWLLEEAFTEAVPG